MRFPAYKTSKPSEGDMTPMIDMTFQLIAFFMIAMNFSQAEQDERVMLPASVLAKPPDRPLENPVVVNVTRDGKVIYGGQELAEHESPASLPRQRTHGARGPQAEY